VDTGLHAAQRRKAGGSAGRASRARSALTRTAPP